jgi:S-adenosylmethionine-diacylglycerol 3-amino-3-carboxypropyl transferase
MTTQPSPDFQGPSAKVQLSELVFTLSWEDPELDREAFALAPGARLATIASGGCNALTFLLDDPAHVLAFDYNPAQVHVLELKRAAFARLEHGEMLELLGVRLSKRRDALFRALEPALSPDARAYFAARDSLFSRGLLGAGRYERFVRTFRGLLRVIHGERRLAALFEPRSLAEQAAFFEREWNTWAWRLVFKGFFNKTMLARRGLSADYFSFDDGSRSFAESFAARTARALCDIPTRDNPFLAQYVLGRYLSEESLPAYLRPEHFDTLRLRIERLEARILDVRHAFAEVPTGSLDAICLSNVFELMSPAETERALADAARVLKPGGTLTLRNLMVPRSVPGSLAQSLALDVELSRALHARDRSFVYSSFQVYRRTERENA